MATTQWPWAADTSKLNKMELTKLDKDGLDVYHDLMRYVETGFDSIDPSDKDLFKWMGIYQQKPNTGHFMMRIKVPTGIMTSDQARVLAHLCQKYARNVMDVTTRQAIQLHWLQIQDMRDIFEKLASVGLTSIEACGDCPRTIIGNPLAGIDPNELIDTRPIVKEVFDFFNGNKEFSNLPRKYKMSISGNIYNVGHAEINDLAFTPATKEIDGHEVVGFHVHVGGGLSAKPYLAQKLDMFVRPEEVLKVAIGVTSIFRDFGYREKRHHARLKFLMADWGPEKFLEELTKLIGEFPKQGNDETKGWNAGYFHGVHEQKQPGLHYVGLSVPVGRFSGDEMEELARLADQYGDGQVRTCNSQNLVLAGIPTEKLNALLAEPLLERLTPNPPTFTGYAVSCTGNEFCNLALVETKERMRTIAQFLDEHVDLEGSIRIHVNGCPNSCGQQQIADIGLQGSVMKTPAGMIDAYDLSIGGTLEGEATFNTKLKGRIPADHVGPVLAELITYYKENRELDEQFHAFVKRVGTPAFQERLTGILAGLAV